MNSVVTFDTNFIIENKSDLKEILSSIKGKYELVIPKIVIEELKGQKVRETITNYNKIIEKINESKKDNNWLDITDSTNLKEITEKQEEKIDNWLTKAFEGKIIQLNNSNLLETVLERCKYKRPPFNNEANSSDKGFKDTLLFLSLLDYMRKSNFEEMYLITNDKVIKKYKEDLENELYEETNKKLIIVSGNEEDLYRILEIEKTAEKHKTKSENDIDFFSESKFVSKISIEETKELINNIFKELDSNLDFVTWKLVELEEIESTLERLEQTIRKFVFLDKTDINNFFDVQANNGFINIKYLEELTTLYKKMSDEEKESLAYALKYKFNSYYKELPF